MDLLKLLENFESSKPIIISKNRKILKNDIVSLLNENVSEINKLKSKNVAIVSKQIDDTILQLFLLDGNVNSILLIPGSLSDDLKSGFYKDCNIHFEVCLEKKKLKFNEVFKYKKNTQDKTFWILPTSGTTQKPKLVKHTLKSLTKTYNKHFNDRFNLVWGLTYDICRFAGIQVFLQAFYGGSSLCVPESLFSFKTMIEDFSYLGCNALSATPSFWRKFLMMKEINNLKLKFITLGGEIADKHILKQLKEAYSDARITHVYASTEAGVGFSVSDGLSGFPLYYLKEGFKGISFKISEGNTLLIFNKESEQEYVSSEAIRDHDNYIDTGDIVEVSGDRVYFVGRDSGSINVGGNKVIPEEVERVLLSSGYVVEARVFSKPNVFMGNLVCAELKLNESYADINDLKLKLLQYCKDNLVSYKVPALLNIVDHIELSTSGKVLRNK